VLATPTGELHATTRGTFEGAIGISGDVPRGTNGFGYDPLFVVAPDLQHTSAELDAGTKNAMSHRGKAARAMAEKIAATQGT
ncbi:MAG: non-canonical purine NTP pyrophosphatase, partial [Planctomycetota bacterium]